MSGQSVYLDYAATTPVDPRVSERMSACMTMGGVFGNPASLQHDYGRTAHEAVEQARSAVAELIGAEPAEIVWTSGATESSNLALKGVAEAYADRGRHIITMKTEHKSVVDCCRYLEQKGWRVTWLPVATDGRLNPEDLEQAIADDTVLVSVMMVNNETGVVQDIETISHMTRERDVLFHVDAAQAAGKIPIDVNRQGIDLLSLSAHKLYGPKGIGALYVRRQPRVRVAAQIHGGGHERGMRSGTLPVHQIVGMGEACRLAGELMNDEAGRVSRLRDRLWEALSELPDVLRNGSAEHCVAGILNVSIAGVDGEALHAGLSGLKTPVAISSGSACTAASQESSYVLRALGRDDELAYASVRFSLGRWTTEDEIDQVAFAVTALVNALRRRSPKWLQPVEASEPAMAARHSQFSDEVWRYYSESLHHSGRGKEMDKEGLVVECGTPGSRAVLRLAVQMDAERITAADFQSYGCVSALAVGAWLCDRLQDQRLSEISISSAEIESALGLAPIKRHCALLAEDALGMLKEQWSLNLSDTDQRAAS